MLPFMFVIDGVPLPENHNYSTIGGAKIHIWVIDTEIESAKYKAISYVSQYLWHAQSIEYAFEILPEQIRELDIIEATLYQKALRDGISATFFAYPKVDGNPDDPIQITHP